MDRICFIPSDEFQESPYYYEIDRYDPETGLKYTMALKPGAPLELKKEFEEYRQWCIQDYQDMLNGIDR